MEFFDRPFDIRELELDRLLPDAIVVSLDPSGPESAANPSFIGAVHRLREWSRESPTVAGSFVVLRPRLGP
jgi:hypothetical protein